MVARSVSPRADYMETLPAAWRRRYQKGGPRLRAVVYFAQATQQEFEVPAWRTFLRQQMLSVHPDAATPSESNRQVMSFLTDLLEEA